MGTWCPDTPPSTPCHLVPCTRPPTSSEQPWTSTARKSSSTSCRGPARTSPTTATSSSTTSCSGPLSVRIATLTGRCLRTSWWYDQCCGCPSQEVRLRLVAGKPVRPVQGDRRERRRCRFVDEWLGFAYKNYQSQTLPAAFDKEDKDAFVADCKEVGNTASESYKKIYWFSWKCFQAADADRDGQVSGDEFATMIAISTANQKRLGLPAPFQTGEERDACFKAMDENGDGAISYDEWLSFFLKDIISPVAAL